MTKKMFQKVVVFIGLVALLLMSMLPPVMAHAAGSNKIQYGGTTIETNEAVYVNGVLVVGATNTTTTNTGISYEQKAQNAQQFMTNGKSVAYDLREYSLAYDSTGRHLVTKDNGEYKYYKNSSGNKVKNPLYLSAKLLDYVDGFNGLKTKVTINGKTRKLLNPYDEITQGEIYTILRNIYGGNAVANIGSGNNTLSRRQATEVINNVASRLGVTLQPWNLDNPNATATKDWFIMSLVSIFTIDKNLCPTNLQPYYGYK